MIPVPTDVRTELHELIDSIQNQSVLEAVYTILTEQRRATLPPVVPGPEAAAAIAEGLQQLAAGQGIPHEQVMADIWAKYGH